MVKTTQMLMVGVALAAMLASPAHALRDPLIEGARQCTQYFPVEEKKNNIPTHLLAAIATTESGRYHQGLGMSVPWPWTINVEGKGYYFDTKAEAVAQVQALMAKGVRSIDVGCMQVNLKHHPRAFTDLNQAFEPAKNVAYAAKFLRENYAGLGDWIKATAAYHSRTAHHGQRYLGEIERSWNRIVGKVAAARAGKGGQPTATKNTASAKATNPVVAAVKPRVVESGRSATPVRSARVIQVREALNPSRNEVMVVKATPAPEVTMVKVADAAPVASAPQAMVASDPIPASNSVRRVNLDNTTNAGVATSGPQFVFAN